MNASALWGTSTEPLQAVLPSAELSSTLINLFIRAPLAMPGALFVLETSLTSAPLVEALHFWSRDKLFALTIAEMENTETLTITSVLTAKYRAKTASIQLRHHPDMHARLVRLGTSGILRIVFLVEFYIAINVMLIEIFAKILV